MSRRWDEQDSRALCGNAFTDHVLFCAQAMSGEGDGFADLLARPLDGAHTDAVWQLQWIEKSQGRGERLVSISADGRVKEWSTKKGLVCTGA